MPKRRYQHTDGACVLRKYKITLADIARPLNISVATVHRIVGGKTGGGRIYDVLVVIEKISVEAAMDLRVVLGLLP